MIVSLRNVWNVPAIWRRKYANWRDKAAFKKLYSADCSVSHQYLNKFSKVFWDNQWFGRNQIYLKLKLETLQFMAGIKKWQKKFLDLKKKKI
jgi:hypothetical protein